MMFKRRCCTGDTQLLDSRYPFHNYVTVKTFMTEGNILLNIMQTYHFGAADVELLVGDITHEYTDAIVNAANKNLAPGGGVAGAIHRAAGSQLWEECKTLGGCKTGEAKITRGYNLPAVYVIHTVGSVYSGKPQDACLLASCYHKCMDLAKSYKLQSISFPALSTGTFGYPMKQAATITFKTLQDILKKNQLR
jgi:O-acetyl-ADP-ribose deacetylase (regulator of RNase III)